MKARRYTTGMSILERAPQLSLTVHFHDPLSCQPLTCEGARSKQSWQHHYAQCWGRFITLPSIKENLDGAFQVSCSLEEGAYY